ncbi:hypothetical protein P4123_10870 [Pseudomonas aeruginosa]|nr:hypothetical protein [Pseudomonas aeruginosa]
MAAVAEDDFILWTYQAAPWADPPRRSSPIWKKDATGMRFGGSQSKDWNRRLKLRRLRGTGRRQADSIPF